jgi:hypothetical protein
MQTINIGDRVELRKAHPCGSREWEVYRIGADIGLRCVGCSRRVMLIRSDFNKRLKRVLFSVNDQPPSSDQEMPG